MIKDIKGLTTLLLILKLIALWTALTLMSVCWVIGFFAGLVIEALKGGYRAFVIYRDKL